MCFGALHTFNLHIAAYPQPFATAAVPDGDDGDMVTSYD